VSKLSSSPTRRGLLATTAAIAAFGLVRPASAGSSGDTQRAAASGENMIRPFHIDSPEAHVVDLRRHIAATRWPEQETVADAPQGVRLATMRADRVPIVAPIDARSVRTLCTPTLKHRVRTWTSRRYANDHD
jgi:hypothetical protein